MWRWAILASLAALVAVACVEVRLVPGGSSSSTSGAGGAPTSSSAMGGLGGAGGAGGGTASCSCDALDVVLVIDNTSSIENNIFELVSVFLQLDEYVQQISERACSFHYGVITAKAKDDQPDPECHQLGSLSYTNADNEECIPGRRFATEQDPLLDVVACFATPGAENDGNERLLESLVNGISDPSFTDPGGCNVDFFRPNAPLIVLMLTDIDDVGSDIDDDFQPDMPSDWHDALVAARGGDPSKVAALGLIPPASGDDCEGGFAPRLHSFLSAFPDGLHNSANVCDTNTTEVRDKVLGLADQVCPIP